MSKSKIAELHKIVGAYGEAMIIDATGASIDQTIKIDLYIRALTALRNRPGGMRWRSNYHKFIKWEAKQQLKWIGYIEKSAVLDPPLPMARELYMMALTLRMTT